MDGALTAYKSDLEAREANPYNADWPRLHLTKGIHLVIMPGLLIFITVLCLYVIGDGVRDAFDPTATD